MMTSTACTNEKMKMKTGGDESKNLFAAIIDQNPQSSKIGNALALTLPFILAALLASSYTLLSLINDQTVGNSMDS